MAWGATLVHGDKTKGEDNALLVLKFESGGIGALRTFLDDKGRAGSSQRDSWLGRFDLHRCHTRDAESLPSRLNPPAT